MRPPRDRSKTVLIFPYTVTSRGSPWRVRCVIRLFLVFQLKPRGAGGSDTRENVNFNLSFCVTPDDKDTRPTTTGQMFNSPSSDRKALFSSASAVSAEPPPSPSAAQRPWPPSPPLAVRARCARARRAPRRCLGPWRCWEQARRSSLPMDCCPPAATPPQTPPLTPWRYQRRWHRPSRAAAPTAVHRTGGREVDPAASRARCAPLPVRPRAAVRRRRRRRRLAPRLCGRPCRQQRQPRPSRLAPLPLCYRRCGRGRGCRIHRWRRRCHHDRLGRCSCLGHHDSLHCRRQSRPVGSLRPGFRLCRRPRCRLRRRRRLGRKPRVLKKGTMKKGTMKEAQ